MNMKRPLTSLYTFRAFSYCIRKNPSPSTVYQSVQNEDSFFTLGPADSTPMPDFAKAGIEERFVINLSLNKYPNKNDLDGKEVDDILRFINEELPNEMYFYYVSLRSSQRLPL